MTAPTPGLFDSIVVRGVTIPNRIVKSAMAEGSAGPDGRPLERLARMYERWARGGVGLAITGMAHVRRGHGFTQHEIGLYDDALVQPLAAIPEAVHRHGGRVFAQICHADPQIPRARARALGAVAPSAGLSRTTFLWTRAIDDGELRRVIDELAAAARRAREAGFDGVQLHAAHGYLLSRMLSPLHNRRTDAWGGSFEGRFALLRESILAVRRAVGDDFPVTVKLNAHDGEPGRGLDLDTGVRIGAALEAIGVDAIEVSAGTADVGMGCYPNRGGLPADLGRRYLATEFPFMRPILPFLPAIVKLVEPTVRMREEGYFLPEARRFARALQIPVIAVGGFRSRSVAEGALADGVGMVSLARPLVRQPDLPNAWREGRATKAQCVSCNRCFVQLGLGERLRCWAAQPRPTPSPSA